MFFIFKKKKKITWGLKQDPFFSSLFGPPHLFLKPISLLAWVIFRWPKSKNQLDLNEITPRLAQL